jgi:hypothetical protein
MGGKGNIEISKTGAYFNFAFLLVTLVSDHS